MSETFAIVTAGFCTAVGVVEASHGVFRQEIAYGAIVMLVLAALWYLNSELMTEMKK